MQQRCLHAVPPVFGQRGRAAELSDTLIDSQAGAAGEDTVTLSDVPFVGRHRIHVGEDPLEQLPFVRLVTGRPIERVGVEKPGRDRVHPPVSLSRARAQDDDRSVGRALRQAVDDVLRQRQAQHVLEADELVTAACESLGDGGIGERREFDLNRTLALVELVLELVERTVLRHAIEAETGDFVERRSGLDEYRRASGDRSDQSGSLEARVSSRRAFGNQLAFSALDALGE